MTATAYNRLDIVTEAGALYLANEDNNRVSFTPGDWTEIPGGSIDLAAYRTAAAQDTIDGDQDTAIGTKIYHKRAGLGPRQNRHEERFSCLTRAKNAHRHV